MSRKILAIDPDVFRAASVDPRCQFLLMDLINDQKKSKGYAIALDGADVEREYTDLIYSDDINPEAKKFLQDCLNQRRRSDFVQVVQPSINDELQQKLSDHKCLTPVEPALISIAAGDVNNITIVLVGEDSHRRRCLHDKEIHERFRRYFRAQLRRGFAVSSASDIKPPYLDDDLIAFHTRIFEYEVAEILAKRICSEYEKYQVLVRRSTGVQYQCETTTGKIKGEIDCYVEAEIDGVRYIWIAECELRAEGNEAQPTRTEKVEQLSKHLRYIEFHENNDTEAEVCIRGYLVTNAEFLHPDAIRLLEENQLQFVTVKIKRGWTRNNKWKLRNEDFGQYSV